MKVGLYYSTRDWFHPDYLVGDNAKYDAWYRGQVEELLRNYGQIDLMWFDPVGGRDWGKWRLRHARAADRRDESTARLGVLHDP